MFDTEMLRRRLISFRSRCLSRCLLIGVIAASIGFVATAHQAKAAVYWGSYIGGLGAANLDGSEPQWEYFYGPNGSESTGPSCGVAVNSEYLYWAGPRGIGRRKLEGEGLYPGTVVPHLEGPCGLALDQSHVYWGNPGVWSPFGRQGGSIGRANLDGSEPNSGFIAGLENPCGVAVGGNHFFWVERGGQTNGGIGRAALDGSSSERSFLSFSSRDTSCALAVSGGYLYWSQDGAIARANIEGGEEDDAFIPDVGQATGIAVQAEHIYWASRQPDGNASIGRAGLDGSEANPAWIAGSEPEFGGVAVDERPTPPYLVLPSRGIGIAPSVEYNLRSGAALLRAYVPPKGPTGSSAPKGRLAVTSRGLSWKVFASTRRLASEGGSYLWWVRIRSGKGAVGRRIRSQLRRRGWARVKVHLVYEAERAYPVEATRKLILRRYRGVAAGWVKYPRPVEAKRDPS